MPDLVESATIILTNSQHVAELSGLNIANSTTPAYKKTVSFGELVAATNQADPTRGRPAATGPVTTRMSSVVDFTAGKLVRTDNPYDLAISGPGFFAVRQDDTLHYVRAGRFTRTSEGCLVDGRGRVLQKADGGDLMVDEVGFTVLHSGEVTRGGGGRVGVFAAADGSSLASTSGGFAASAAGMVAVDGAEIVQGAYEASNVSTGDEMVAIMQALRQAESGQRVMIAYDDIMGRVLSAFGDSVR